MDFRNRIKGEWLPCPSNGHFVEAGVKEASIAASTGKEDKMRSVVAIGRDLATSPTRQRNQVAGRRKLLVSQK
jgi:hypothetical protein